LPALIERCKRKRAKWQDRSLSAKTGRFDSNIFELGGNSMPKYWIAGAMVSNQNMVETFIKHNFWFGDKETAQDKIARIKKGDRMAIKKMLGQGASKVAIKAIGIVEEIGNYNALQFRIVYVNWVDFRDEDRKVPFSGFGGTIHGPYDGSEPIIQEIFTLCP
jgi:hypothetical protein